MITKEIIILITSSIVTLLVAGGAFFLYEITKIGDLTVSDLEAGQSKTQGKYVDNTSEVLNLLPKDELDNDGQVEVEKTFAKLPVWAQTVVRKDKNHYFPNFDDVRGVDIDEDMVWVAAFSGVYVYSKEQEEIIHVFTQADGFTSSITALKVIGNIVFVGTQGGLHILDKKTGAIQNMRDDTPGNNKFNSNIKNFVVDENTLWMKTFGGVRGFDLTALQWIPVDVLPSKSVLKELENDALGMDEKNTLNFLKEKFGGKIIGTDLPAIRKVLHVFNNGNLLVENIKSEIGIFNPVTKTMKKTKIPYGEIVVVGNYVWAIKNSCDGMGCVRTADKIVRYNIRTGEMFEREPGGFGGSAKILYQKGFGGVTGRNILLSDIKPNGPDSASVYEFFEYDIESDVKRSIGEFENVSFYARPVFNSVSNAIIAVNGTASVKNNIISIDVDSGKLTRLVTVPNNNRKIRITSIVVRDNRIYVLNQTDGIIYRLDKQYAIDGNRRHSFNRSEQFGLRKIWQADPKMTHPFEFIILGGKLVFKTSEIVDWYQPGVRDVFMTNSKYRMYKQVYKYITHDDKILTVEDVGTPMSYDPAGIPVGNDRCIWWRDEYGHGGVWGGCE